MKALKNLTYQSFTQKKRHQVVMAGQQLWMTQLQMSTLFGCSVQEVYTVLKGLFHNRELDERVVNRSIVVENSAGHYVPGNFYNLDAIIAVGYRLNPKETTYFSYLEYADTQKSSSCRYGNKIPTTASIRNSCI